MRRYLRIGAAGLAAFLLAAPLAAQVSATASQGREFWVVFQKNFRDFIVDERTNASVAAAELKLSLSITSQTATSGYVEIPGLGFRREFKVEPGVVTTVAVDSAAQLRSSERVERLGVHVVANDPVVVYGLDHRYQATDTYIAYPVASLGSAYRAMGYRWLQNDLMSQVAIVATEDGTQVKINPSVKTREGKRAGETFEVKLNRGETYQVIAMYEPTTTGDLSGTLIVANKRIAVFSGHNCAYVPNIRVKACNLLIEQLPAINTWGRQVIVGALAMRSSSVYRVLAAEDGTEIFENGKSVATLKAGEFYENINQREHTAITASKGVMVAQFAKGFDNGDNLGDPMMIIVPPVEQFAMSYRFSMPVTGSWNHFVNVVAPVGSVDGLRLNGAPVDAKSFTPVGESGYAVGQVRVDYGTHLLEGSVPFGIYQYGFGFDDAAYDAYGNSGGQQLRELRGGE